MYKLETWSKGFQVESFNPGSVGKIPEQPYSRRPKHGSSHQDFALERSQVFSFSCFILSRWRVTPGGHHLYPQSICLPQSAVPGVDNFPTYVSDHFRLSGQLLDSLSVCYITRGAWPLCDPRILHFGLLNTSQQHLALQSHSPGDNTMICL